MNLCRIASAGAACLAALFLINSSAVGHEARRPSCDIGDIHITSADHNHSSGWFNITNSTGGDGYIMIESIDMEFEWIGQGGVKVKAQNMAFQATAGPGGLILPNTTYKVEFWIQVSDAAPFVAHEIKNWVYIKLNNRDKIYHNSGGFQNPGP